MFVTFGVLYSFGVFFKPMTAEFGAGRGATSLVFSITAFIAYILGPATGHLSDRLGPRLVLATSAVTMGVGLVLTAFIGRLWVGYLTYGLGVGIGVACAYVPMLAVVSRWFVHRRSTALGIAVAGIGLGTLAIAPATAPLIARYGWRTTNIMMGAASAVILLLCALFIEEPVLAPAPTKLGVGQSLRSFEFIILYTSWLLSTMALFVPFVFLPAFARNHGATPVAAAALVGFIGGASVAGRLAMGVLADRVGVMWLLKATVFILGASFAIWLALPSYQWLVIFTIVLGLGYGGRIALLPATAVEFFGTKALGAVLGFFFTSAGFAALFGPPLAGLIVDYTGSYDWGIIFSLAMGMAGFVVILPLKRRPMLQDSVEENRRQYES